MTALAAATRQALKEAGISGDKVEAIALDTTGSSVIPVAADMSPLDDYYLWCDHRAKQEAAEITEAAHREKLEAIQWCGGVYSSEWGWAKLLHWLRHNPEKRKNFASAFEHCDMVAATLCGITQPGKGEAQRLRDGPQVDVERRPGRTASGKISGEVDPLLAGVRAKLEGEYATSDKIAGKLAPQWAEKLGLRAGIPIPVGAFDAHWDAIGAGAQGGRRGERGGHLDVHHRVRESGAVDSRRLRRGAGQRASGVHGSRGGALGHGRHLQRHRGPRQHHRCRTEQGAGGLSAPDRPGCCA